MYYFQVHLHCRVEGSIFRNAGGTNAALLGVFPLMFMKVLYLHKILTHQNLPGDAAPHLEQLELSSTTVVLNELFCLKYNVVFWHLSTGKDQN